MCREACGFKSRLPQRRGESSLAPRLCEPCGGDFHLTRSSQPSTPCQEIDPDHEIRVPEVPLELRSSVKLALLDRLFAWARKRSLSPLLFGLTCCDCDMAASGPSQFDSIRPGLDSMSASYREPDLMIVTGTVTMKIAPLLVNLYDQMAKPTYVIAMGACAISGGPFKEGYSVVSGVDRLIPVDIYIPGCPPHPEALLHGILTLQDRLDPQTRAEVRTLQPRRDVGIAQPILEPSAVNWRDLEGLVGPRQEES